jgi:hypothetical protein
MHSLGWTGESQVLIAALIIVALCGMIMTEVVHRTLAAGVSICTFFLVKQVNGVQMLTPALAAVICAALSLFALSLQNRVPSLSKVCVCVCVRACACACVRVY